MTKYQQYGKPGWTPRSGQVSALLQNRRASLVRKGLASWWLPLRSVGDAIKAAGI
jgi:ABC-type cobalt transport system substrate-binding protein